MNMKYLVTFAALMICQATWAQTNHDYGAAIVSEVTSIYDGDTFRANIKGWPDIVGRRIPIRVAGIDTPELRGKCQLEKEMARQAKQTTVAMLRSGKRIELRHIRRGKYFRLLADVWIDGERLADRLIKAGLAVPYDGDHKRDWCHSE